MTWSVEGVGSATKLGRCYPGCLRKSTLTMTCIQKVGQLQRHLPRPVRLVNAVAKNYDHRLNSAKSCHLNHPLPIAF
eukprot:2291680-Amphidinium_carterae.1